MRPTRTRLRLGPIVLLAGLSLFFVWDSVHGQGFRPRVPGMPNTPPRPPFGGGMGGGFQSVYSCSKCGNEMVAKSGSILDKPSNCSRCGVRFINGGLGGTGKSTGGTSTPSPIGAPGNVPGTIPGTIPGTPPMAPNGVPQNPATNIPPQMPNTPMQPPITAPPIAPATQPPVSGSVPSSPAASTFAPSTAPAPARSSWVLFGVIAIVVLGLVGVGGVWMMIASMKGQESPPRRSRSRRRRDDDDYDD